MSLLATKMTETEIVHGVIMTTHVDRTAMGSAHLIITMGAEEATEIIVYLGTTKRSTCQVEIAKVEAVATLDTKTEVEIKVTEVAQSPPRRLPLHPHRQVVTEDPSHIRAQDLYHLRMSN